MVEPHRRSNPGDRLVSTGLASGYRCLSAFHRVGEPGMADVSGHDVSAQSLLPVHYAALPHHQRLCKFSNLVWNPDLHFVYLETGQMLRQHDLTASSQVNPPDAEPRADLLDLLGL